MRTYTYVPTEDKKYHVCQVIKLMPNPMLEKGKCALRMWMAVQVGTLYLCLGLLLNYNVLKSA